MAGPATVKILLLMESNAEISAPFVLATFAFSENKGGSEMVMVVDPVHPMASVTMNVYVPAVRI
jgi:hypothetical protein